MGYAPLCAICPPIRMNGVNRWHRDRCASISPTKTKRIHNERECRRGLAAARVVQVITRTRRTPIRENTHEPTFFNESFHPVFRQIRKPKALKCRILHQCQRVEDGPTLDANFKLATALPEFPGVEASMGG